MIWNDINTWRAPPHTERERERSMHQMKKQAKAPRVAHTKPTGSEYGADGRPWDGGETG